MTNMYKILNVLLLSFIFSNLVLSSFLKNNSKLKSLTESEAKSLMEKYQPVVYFHEKEEYFPTAIESFIIDWTKVTFEDGSAVYDTNDYKGENSLKQDSPIYVSILENSDGTIRISYLFLFGWNNSGPEIQFKAKATGIGIEKSVVAGKYGLDLHYSDVEHIEVNLKSDKSTVSSIRYAYHQWTNDFSASEVTWEGTHPVVYCALGSHASYNKGGDIVYKEAFEESKKVLGVTVYNTYLRLVDFCANSKNSRWLSTNPRLLKLNGNAVSNISTDEYNLGFKYSGRLGAQYDNNKWDDFKDDIKYDDFMKIIKKVSKSGYNKIKDKMSEVEKLFEASASKSFYSRSFW